ncbi:MAG: hypothetical protein NXI20_17810 [bacterium]|nr:hypothetical protein [bacterium]
MAKYRAKRNFSFGFPGKDTEFKRDKVYTSKEVTKEVLKSEAGSFEEIQEKEKN